MADSALRRFLACVDAYTQAAFRWTKNTPDRLLSELPIEREINAPRF